jgi:hypothetical protein
MGMGEKMSREEGVQAFAAHRAAREKNPNAKEETLAKARAL